MLDRTNKERFYALKKKKKSLVRKEKKKKSESQRADMQRNFEELRIFQTTSYFPCV